MALTRRSVGFGALTAPAGVRRWRVTRGIEAAALPEPEPEPPPLDLAKVGSTSIGFACPRLESRSPRATRARRARPAEALSSAARGAVESLCPLEAVRDPLFERGTFDHRYDADAR